MKNTYIWSLEYYHSVFDFRLLAASLSCCSKSNSTASSAVVLSDNSSSHEKFKPPNPTFNKPSNVQFTRDEYGIGFLHCGGSLHYPRSNLKSSPKTIDNNLINDIDNDNNCKLDQDNVISTICQNKVKPEVKITIEETEQSKNQHHKLHKNSIRHKISRKFADANEDSNIVNYNCNGSTSKLSPERINLHQVSTNFFLFLQKCIDRKMSLNRYLCLFHYL